MLSCYITNECESTTSIVTLASEQITDWLEKQNSFTQAWLKSNDFQAKQGELCLIPDQEGRLNQVLIGIENKDVWQIGDLPSKLPAGDYRLADEQGVFTTPQEIEQICLAWGLGCYQFTRYNNNDQYATRLLLPSEVNQAYLQHCVAAIYSGRDLINTPTEDLNPYQLAQSSCQLAKEFAATIKVISGEDLLSANYPTIFAVGRAAHNPPQLIDVSWGDKNCPKITLVGKGICFDSGGLDIKSAAGMRLMKKDMGGAAHVLALARMIMANQLPVRLRVIIAAAENAVGSRSYRPGDVITTRAGIRVEVTNTDAEGRLVMCDALSAACEEKPDYLIDFATLTGAARVALGPDLPVLLCNDASFAEGLSEAGLQVNDPIWRLPLYQPYQRFLASDIADISNASQWPYAGAITAGLYLQRFVDSRVSWAHFDVMGWNLEKLPSKPIGGEIAAVRAVYAYLLNKL